MRSHALLDELAWRGMLYQHTDDVAAALQAGPVRGYIGFDPTAPSLHVGHLRQVMLLTFLQRHGSRPVALVGGGTGLIGDPSGRSSERPLATEAAIARNADSLHAQLSRFLDFTGSNGAAMINNAEWLLDLRAVEFMRDVGKHFTVNYMLQKDSVKSRMEAGISYTEFSYMLLQAYDFLELHRRHGVTLQLGGSDQWGNITAGIELIRRSTGGDAHAVTSPLVTTSAGTKFGKTEAGAVWLDPRMTSPYKFYQFWINVDDRDVPDYLRGFTFLSREQVEALVEATKAHPEARHAQRTLAADVTTRVHGVAALTTAEEVSNLLFGGGDPAMLSLSALETLRDEIPHAITSDRNWFEIDRLITALSTGATPVFKSKGDARRTIQQGGLYVNDERIGADQTTIDRAALLHGRFALVRKGARTFALLEVVAA